MWSDVFRHVIVGAAMKSDPHSTGTHVCHSAQIGPASGQSDNLVVVG